MPNLIHADVHNVAMLGGMQLTKEMVDTGYIDVEEGEEICSPADTFAASCPAEFIAAKNCCTIPTFKLEFTMISILKSQLPVRLSSRLMFQNRSHSTILGPSSCPH